MKLWIDGREIDAKTGQTMLELVRELGLDTNRLSTRPIAAKIAGECMVLLKNEEDILPPAEPAEYGYLEGAVVDAETVIESSSKIS